MRPWTGLFLIIAALLLGGCDSVSSPVPVGEKAMAIDPEAWEGRWANADGRLDITVVDAAKGLVRVAYAEEGECGEMDMELRSSGEWIFVNVTAKDFAESEGLAKAPCKPAQAGAAGGSTADGSDNEGGYLWGRITQTEKAIVAWSPAPEAFVRLVNSGQVPGTIQDGSVVLGKLEPQHYEIITTSSMGVVMDWEKPLVLYRVESED
jgi:hypothetical protein